LGILGSYLAHVYDEVKHRPPYIVESILNAPTAESSEESSQRHGREAAPSVRK
jgi:hypothetical protein